MLVRQTARPLLRPISPPSRHPLAALPAGALLVRETPPRDSELKACSVSGGAAEMT